MKLKDILETETGIITIYNQEAIDLLKLALGIMSGRRNVWELSDSELEKFGVKRECNQFFLKEIREKVETVIFEAIMGDK